MPPCFVYFREVPIGLGVIDVAHSGHRDLKISLTFAVGKCGVESECG